MLPCAHHLVQHPLGHTHCIDDALKQAENICSKYNLRFTALRRQILTLIWANHEPSKAYDILGQLSQSNNQKPAQPPTVYRALDFLLEHGLVHRLNSLNAYIGCGHPQKHSECYFLICTRCGKTEECCDSGLKKRIQSTAKNCAFHVAHSSLEIEGECQQCHT